MYIKSFAGLRPYIHINQSGALFFSVGDHDLISQFLLAFSASDGGQNPFSVHKESEK